MAEFVYPRGVTPEFSDLWYKSTSQFTSDFVAWVASVGTDLRYPDNQWLEVLDDPT